MSRHATLTPAAKQIVENVVGRLSVLADRSTLRKTIDHALKEDVPEEFRQACYEHAYEVHDENLALYRGVMRGAI